MSKERELLVKAWNLLIYLMGGKIGDGISSINRKFLYELKEYISQPEQPEQTEQEPVAWMSLSDIEWMNIVNHPKILELTDGRHNSEEAVNLAVKMTEEKCKKNNSDSIPKRPPLTRQQISVGNQSMLNVTREAFVKGVKFAEDMHGIGGGAGREGEKK